MPVWRINLGVEFKEPVRFRLRFFRFFRRKSKEFAGFYQVYGITADSLDSAKQALINRVNEKYPEWQDNMDFDFEQTEEWTSGYARQRLATDLEKQAKG